MPDDRALADLQGHFKEMFQFESSDLDFGIYKIIRLKQAEVSAFIDDELPVIVRAELSKAATGAGDARFQQLAAFVKEELGPKYHSYVVSPETVAENRDDLRERVEGAGGDAGLVDAIADGGGADPETEDRVYNRLLGFFQRYYRGGDFGYNDRSLATYKVDYPEPEADYDGSDVLLHWKHKDSYYIKTAAGFPSVRFELDGKTIEYRLDAGGADESAKTRNNNKDDGRKHYELAGVAKTEDGDETVYRVTFRLAERSTTKADVLSAVMAEAFGQTDGLDLYLYRPAKKGEERGKPAFNDLAGDFDRVEGGSVKGQGRLRQALDTYLNGIVKHDQFKEGGKNNDERIETLRNDDTVQRLHALDQRLNTFYAGVDADYFVHKNLGGFLTREAGRYVKDVILSDVAGLLADDRDETALLVARAFYRVAERVIAFLAATEEFQKNVFLLKKKVARTDWLVSVGKLSEWIPDDAERAALLDEVLAVGALRDEWKATFGVEVGDPNQLLLLHPTLPISTRLLPPDLARRLLAVCPDIEAETTGLLLNSENLQALRLLADTYRGRVECIYIDPPYNTGGDGFLYKDAFRHSSWLSMMSERVEAARELLADTGLMLVSIDEGEQARLQLLLDSVFGRENFMADIAWEKRFTRSNNAKLYSTVKEHILSYRRSPSLSLLREARTASADALYTNPDDDPRGAWTSVSYVNPASREDRQNLAYPIQNPITKETVEHPTNAWKYSAEENERHAKEDRLYWGEDGGYEYPRLKLFLSDVGGLVPVDLWKYKDSGTTDEGSVELQKVFGGKIFENPKPTRLIERIAKYRVDDQDSTESTYMDFFAGSGTTGHAILKLNREDDGNRRFILVEMGEYFERVLLERIRRVMYSLDWKDGAPKGAASGTVGLVKVQTLQGYEDVLDAVAADGTDLPDGAPVAYLYRPEEQRLRSSLDVSRPFSNTARVGKTGESHTLDLLETYAYFQGLSVRQMGDADGGIRWIQSGRHLVAFRDIADGQDDSAALFALLDARDAAGHAVEVLHVNAYVDERKFTERAVTLRVVTTDDFDRGASWS